MMKILMFLLMFSGFFFVDVLAQVSGLNNTSFTVSSVQSNQLQVEKDTLLMSLDSSVSGLNNSLISLISQYDSQGDYRMLQCLNLINLDHIKKSFDEEISALRNTILADYVSINSQIYSLENKKQLGLISDIVYNTEFLSIAMGISGYRQKYDALIIALVSKYQQSISGQGLFIQTLIQQNQDLLNRLGKDYILIQSGLQAFDIMQQWVTKINSTYVGNQESLQDVLIQARERGETQLLNNHLSLIQTTIKNYSNIYGLESLLQGRSNALVESYKSGFSNYFGRLTEGYYNQDDYNFVRFNVNLLKSTYMSGGVLRCESILATNPLINIQDVVPKILQKIETINSGLKISINQLGARTTGNTIEAFSQSLQNFHLTSLLDNVAQLRTYTTSTVQNLMQKSFEQNQQWDEIQLLKKSYDKETNSVKKSELKNRIASLSQKLFSGVVLKTMRDNLITLSQEVGFEYQSEIKVPQISLQNSSDVRVKRIISILENLGKNVSNRQDFILTLQTAISRIDNSISGPQVSLRIIQIMQDVKKAIQQFLLTY